MTALNTYLSGMRAGITPVRALHADRLWEVDALRGIAIIMMVVYHLLWDLASLGGYDIALRTGFWHYWQIATASLFTGLVGLSMTLSYNAARTHGATGSLWPKFAIRGLQIFSWGVLIGVITYFVVGPTGYVRFGILHLIGLSTIIGYPFLRFRWLNLVLGIVVIAVGRAAIPLLRIDLPWMEWLASTPGHGVDYAPLFPWFGNVLIGIFLGNTLYAGGTRRFPLSQPGQDVLVRGLRLLGQNSLLIYLVHQPILIASLTLLGIVHM